MFQGPLVPTAVTRAKQGRGEIDDTGLIPSFIWDVIFQGFGDLFWTDCLPSFSNGTLTLSWFASCSMISDLHPTPTRQFQVQKASASLVFWGLFFFFVFEVFRRGSHPVLHI